MKTFCAWLILSAVSFAGQLRIEAVSATYLTETNDVEVSVWFNQPPTLINDYFGFYGAYDDRGFVIRNDDLRNDLTDVLVGYTIDYANAAEIEEWGEVDYNLTDNILAFSFPFAAAALSSPEFYFSASTYTDAHEGFSHVDVTQVYAPEPNGWIIALIGLTCITYHLHRMRKNLGDAGSRR